MKNAPDDDDAESLRRRGSAMNSAPWVLPLPAPWPFTIDRELVRPKDRAAWRVLSPKQRNDPPDKWRVFFDDRGFLVIVGKIADVQRSAAALKRADAIRRGETPWDCIPYPKPGSVNPRNVVGPKKLFAKSFRELGNIRVMMRHSVTPISLIMRPDKSTIPDPRTSCDVPWIAAPAFTVARVALASREPMELTVPEGLGPTTLLRLVFQTPQWNPTFHLFVWEVPA